MQINRLIQLPHPALGVVAALVLRVCPLYTYLNWFTHIASSINRDTLSTRLSLHLIAPTSFLPRVLRVLLRALVPSYTKCTRHRLALTSVNCETTPPFAFTTMTVARTEAGEIANEDQLIEFADRVRCNRLHLALPPSPFYVSLPIVDLTRLLPHTYIYTYIIYIDIFFKLLLLHIIITVMRHIHWLMTVSLT